MGQEKPHSSTDFYGAILELGSTWSVDEVCLNKRAKEVEVFVSADSDGGVPCPECGAR